MPMPNHREYRKGPQTERQMYRSHEPYLHTISHFPVLYDFFVNIYCRCCDSDFVQLFTDLVFHYGHLIARHTTVIVETAPAFSFIADILVSRVKRLTSYQSRWEGAILLSSLELATLGMLFIKDLNTASRVERSLTTAISHSSSASAVLECRQNLSKLTNQRVYQILVYRNGLCYVCLQAFFPLLSSRLFYFRVTPQLEAWKSL